MMLPKYKARILYTIDIAYDIELDDENDYDPALSQIELMALSTMLQFNVQVFVRPYDTTIRLESTNKREIERAARKIAKHIASVPGTHFC